MTFWFLILFIIPVISGLITWHRSHGNALKEAVIGCILSALIILLTLSIAQRALLADIETLSGRVTELTHTPRWVEQRTVYVPPVTDSDGKTISMGYYKTVYDVHRAKWFVHTTLESIPVYEITQQDFEYLLNNYSLSLETKTGFRPGYFDGDRNDYFSIVPDSNDSLPLIPIHYEQQWSNKLNANPNTLFSFLPVSDTDVNQYNLYPYPSFRNGQIFQSQRLRLVSPDSTITTYQWDQLNSSLGPIKKVNIYLIEFPANSDIQSGQLQQSLWLNGKKNDLVLCVGGSENKRWSYVFGWSESELTKHNLQTILLSNPLNESIIPLIHDEILSTYERFDWNKFNHLPTPVPLTGVIIALVITLIGQIVIHFSIIHHLQPYHKNKLKTSVH